MKVLIIGGTGLIGYEAALLLVKKGHEVISLSLEGKPEGKKPDKITYIKGNYLTMSDSELLSIMNDTRGLVFAAGIDERVESAPPVYDLFKKYNIDSLKRVLTLAKKSTIKHVVICGSYFSYFAKTRPKLNLVKNHPYIRSRIIQESMAFEFADDDFDVAVLELPYIFGIQRGRKPVWVFLVEMIQKMKKHTFFSKGGTTMVTVKQTAQAILGALEKNIGANAYPIGFYNMKWKEFLKVVHEAMGYSENRKVITVPNFIFKLAMLRIDSKRKKQNIEAGLKMSKFVKLQSSNQFITPEEGSKLLGVKPDDIKRAITDSIKLSLEVIKEKKDDYLDMKTD